MKKTLIFILTLSIAFFLGSCNTPGGGGGEEGEPTDVIWTWGDGTTGATLDLTEDTNNYPGRELNLSDCPNISNGTGGTDYVLGDISNYGEAILLVKLYAGETEVTSGTSLAQFNLLLAGSSGWSDAANKLLNDDSGYNLESGVAKTGVPKSGASGKPGKLLVQGSYEQSFTGTKVTKVLVQKLTLKLRTDLPIFTLQYSNPSGKVLVSSNKITFDDATYSQGAAKFTFPDTFPTSNNLSGKKLVFEFKLEALTGVTNPTNWENEFQIHVQAAGKKADDSDGFNGLDPKEANGFKGQFYVTLDDADGEYDQTYNGTTNTGVFKIPFNKLLDAATVSGNSDSDGIQGPFTLSAVRICNNGTVWEGHTRNKSYSIIFNSIKVE